MPPDYKRFNGPEDSVPYKFYTKDYIKGYEELSKELVNADGLRKDGRAMNEFGVICAYIDVVKQAKGSAYMETKNTKVICSVFDPREIPHQNDFSQLGQLFCEVKFASFSCPRQRRPLAPDAEEKAMSVALRQALEPAVCRHMFPNYQIDIFVYIIEHGGACLSAAINVAGLALINAAVPMYDIITAASIAISSERIFLDPTEEEEYVALMGTENTNHGVLTLSFLSELVQVTDFTQIGSMNIECINNALDTLRANCVSLSSFMKNILIKYTTEGLKEKERADKNRLRRDKLLDERLEEWKKKLKIV